jgi:TolA-binding protein
LYFVVIVLDFTTGTPTASSVTAVDAPTAATTAEQQRTAVKPERSDVAATSDSETADSETPVAATPALIAEQQQRIREVEQYLDAQQLLQQQAQQQSQQQHKQAVLARLSKQQQQQQQQEQQQQHWYDADCEQSPDTASKLALVAAWDLPQGVIGAISQAKLAAFFTFPTSGLPGYPGYRIPDCHVTLACTDQSAAALVAFPT